MTFLLWGILLAQDAPLAAERDRLASRPALTETDKEKYRLPPLARAGKVRTTYTLAVIPVDFTDQAMGGTDLSKLFFEQLAGYFSKVSGGRFSLQGEVYPKVTLEGARGDFAERDLEHAVAVVIRGTEGGKLLASDGVAFVLAGKLGKRGSALWPHKDSMRFGERMLDYVATVEEADGWSVSILAHESMHLLGLADKYNNPDTPVGRWCILGMGYSDKNPMPPCAECRERLGWCDLATITPRDSSKVVQETDPSRVVKVLLNPDGSEYLLCELRDRLIIWHVGGNKAVELLGRYPSEKTDRLTPLSDPPFRGRTIGSQPVWITDIRIQDGKAWYTVAAEAPLTPLEEWRQARVGKRLSD